MTKSLLNIRSEIINEYLQGKEPIEILSKNNLKWGEFYNLIAPVLEHDKKNIDQQLKDIIIERYLVCHSTTKIGVDLGIHHKTVSEILKDNNVVIDISKSHRKYNINECYFDVIDNQNKAYFLGFLYADGYNNEKNNIVRLQLDERDKHILDSFNNELKYNKQLSFIRCDDKISKNGYQSCNMYSLDIYSNKISKSLAKLGVVQNKSLLLSFPTDLKEEYYSHFLRGYFDGDGSFCHRYAKGYGWRDVITFTSTDIFCQKAKRIINDYSDAKGGGIYDSSCHNGVTKVLVFSGALQTKKLLEWLYNDANLFLYRKHNKYLQLLVS